MASRDTGGQLADQDSEIESIKVDFMLGLQYMKLCSIKCLILSARGGLVAYLASRNTGGQLADKDSGVESIKVHFKFALQYSTFAYFIVYKL